MIKKHHYFYLVIISIFLTTLLVFSPAIKNDFLYWDDDQYVFKNPVIQTITVKNIKKMVSINIYWMPLTWFSHALDYQLYGDNPHGHHLTSILIHAINAVLVFLFFGVLLSNKGFF